MELVAFCGQDGALGTDMGFGLQQFFAEMVHSRCQLSEMVGFGHLVIPPRSINGKDVALISFL